MVFCCCCRSLSPLLFANQASCQLGKQQDHGGSNAMICSLLISTMMLLFCFAHIHTYTQGDLYWDLFYVSGAFNLAAALKESLNSTGILYFVTCFLAIKQMWIDKLFFDCRYVARDCLTRRTCEIIRYCILGTSVQHIRPVETMSRTGENPTMTIFTSSLVLYHLSFMYQEIDIILNCEGGPEAAVNARNDAFGRLPTLVFLSVATIWSACDLYFGVEGTNHGPIWLILASFFTIQTSQLAIRYIITVWQNKSHKESYVPMNIEHAIHRMGEWVVLMLGESILALLIVEQSPGQRYYTTFFSGIIQITILQYLYFRSNPFDADDHATRRSSGGGFLFSYCIIVYSLSLLCVGCSFKMILHLYLDLEDKEGTIEEILTDESRAIGNLYSWSLAISFLALDVMIISHQGFHVFFSRFWRGDRFLLRPPLITLAGTSLIVCQALLSQWIDDLEVITVVGVGLSLCQSFVGVYALRYFPVAKCSVDALPKY